MEDIDKIIQKYEIPKELQEALWDAYIAGVKRGYIKGAIEEFNKKENQWTEHLN